MENKEALRKELAEEIEAASLLLDDRLYTTKSYYNLVTAIGYGKAENIPKSRRFPNYL